MDITEQFGVIAGVVLVAGVIVVIVTGIWLPLLIVGSVVAAIFCVAKGLAGGNK
jgi:hypothetical protein